MATQIVRTEKEHILNSLYNKHFSLIYLQDRSEYVLVLEQPVKKEMVFRSAQIIPALKPQNKLNLIFNYNEQPISFTVTVLSVKGTDIVCDVPEVLYRNLTRGYSRVNAPSDLELQFTFSHEHYKLPFPKMAKYKAGDNNPAFQNLDCRNLSVLIRQMSKWIRNIATDYRLVIFKNARPQTIEERIVAITGKTLYLPSTALEDFPKSAPRNQFITSSTFKRYLEKAGVKSAHIDDACTRFIQTKCGQEILSDAWAPILFHNYVIGYIHVWLSDSKKPLLDDRFIDTLNLYSKLFAYLLKTDGFFEKWKVPDCTLEGQTIDISTSGLLFACPHSTFPPALLPKNGLTLHIITPDRNISTEAKIMRWFHDTSHSYFGCRFGDLESQDHHFLFEFIYGKPFTEFNAGLLMGQV